MSKEAFTYDPTRGEWTNTRLKTRAAFFSEVIWQHIIENLHSTFGTAADAFLYQFGLGSGIYFGKEAVKNGKNLNALRAMFNTAQEAGWGVYDLHELTDERLDSTSEIKISIKNSYFTSASMNAEEKNLSILKGMTAGIITGFRGHEHTCIVEKAYFDVGWCVEMTIKPLPATK